MRLPDCPYRWSETTGPDIYTGEPGDIKHLCGAMYAGPLGRFTRLARFACKRVIQLELCPEGWR